MMIQTDRLLIRPVEISDSEVLYGWYNDTITMSSLGYNYGLLVSYDAIKKNLEESILNNPLANERLFIICERSTGYAIGQLRYFSYDPRNQSAKVEVIIGNASKRGMGLSFEALRVFIKYIFTQLNLNRVEASILRDNRHAIHLYKKLGFTLEGISRESYYDPNANRFNDIIVMSVLKKEYFNESQ